MTVEEIFNSKEISVRSYNVCINSNLKKISNIIAHYEKYGTFENVRKCGRKSNEELIAIYLKYSDYDFSNIENIVKPKEQLISTIANFTRIKREIVNGFIETNSYYLSNRAKNTITTYLDGDFKIKNISEKIFSNHNFDFQNIRNVGSKTVIELNAFIQSLIDFLYKVAEVVNDNDLISLKNRYFIEKTFSITSIPETILDSQSIFSLVDFLLNREAIFKKSDNYIFQNTFKVYNDRQLFPLEIIAEKLNMSKERVRQVRKIIVENLVTTLGFVKNIHDDLHQKYNIDPNQDFFNIDEGLNYLINQTNNTNFSIEFNSIIIYSYLTDKIDLIGNIEDVLLPRYFNSKNHHNWENFYFVRNNLGSQFDFYGFVNDIEFRLNDRIEESYVFHFKSYLIQFLKTNDHSLIDFISPIAESVINQEFDLIIDIDDNIEFKRNTHKTVNEYVIEILLKLGRPTKIDELYKLLELDQPNLTKSQDSLRGSMQRSKEIIFFGRSSTYGLKRWEFEKEGIKGGTIRTIVIDYLQDKMEPVHILELLEEVHRYRKKTSAKNIITNLKFDTQSQFIVYNQNFIGLSNKKYNTNLTSLPKFLGRLIKSYIKISKISNRKEIEDYCSKEFKVSRKNMNYIIEFLIEEQLLFLDIENNLSI